MSVPDVWHWSLISWEQVMSLWVVIADGLDSQKPALSANIFYKIISGYKWFDEFEP